MDAQDTEPKNSSWYEQLLLASVSLAGPDLEYLEVEGDLDKVDFADRSSRDQAGFNIRLEEPLEREVVLRVPFPDDVERVALAFRVEVKGTFQIGKR